MKKIILASGSARRREILEAAGIDFEIHVSNYEEDHSLKLTPHELVVELSLGKARDIAKHHKNSLIISADTLVVYNGRVYPKAKDKSDAVRMLKELTGTGHDVITGVTIIDTTINREFSFVQYSKVYLKQKTEKEIEEYIEQYKPFDKAGAYGAQDGDGVLVEKIEGEYENVLGLPIKKLLELLPAFT